MKYRTAMDRVIINEEVTCVKADGYPKSKIVLPIVAIVFSLMPFLYICILFFVMNFCDEATIISNKYIKQNIIIKS